jgi:hypothetical protein
MPLAARGRVGDPLDTRRKCARPIGHGRCKDDTCGSTLITIHSYCPVVSSKYMNLDRLADLKNARDS